MYGYACVYCEHWEAWEARLCVLCGLFGLGMQRGISMAIYTAISLIGIFHSYWVSALGRKGGRAVWAMDASWVIYIRYYLFADLGSGGCMSIYTKYRILGLLRNSKRCSIRCDSLIRGDV
ncbi:hypothetical protein F5X97DRAFT_281193 [Nemania serpens]|nr:hypothetical protein F5X97DRAFT_281193 [Nemania serpens]